FDEPLYARYLASGYAQIEHPGHDEILASQSEKIEEVLQNVLLADHGKEVLFFKQMTHHLVGLSYDFLLHMQNVILIRDPRRIIASFAKVIPNPGMDDVGVARQVDLLRFLQKEQPGVQVIDAKDLLMDPLRILNLLCERLGIPFYPGMLAWSPGARPEDGVWAPHWYANVHRSTGFIPYAEKTVELSPALEQLAQRCQPYYDELRSIAIQ
ncbi:MAG: hypothetical protein AAFU60_10475, partial [Bacteroidota bacterium]